MALPIADMAISRATIANRLQLRGIRELLYFPQKLVGANPAIVSQILRRIMQLPRVQLGRIIVAAKIPDVSVSVLCLQSLHRQRGDPLALGEANTVNRRMAIDIGII